MRKFLLIILSVFPIYLYGQELSGKIVYVSDGDTFHFVPLDGTEKIKIRLNGVDCPEKTQMFGLEAKEFVINELKDKNVTVKIMSLDRYGRSIASVSYDGKDLGGELLKNGLAWHYKQYSKDARYASLENEARAKKVGIWSEKSPVEPWAYRKSNKNK